MGGKSTLALPSREKDKTFCSISAQWKRLSPIEKNDKEEEEEGGQREKEKEPPHLRVICRDRSWWVGQRRSIRVPNTLKAETQGIRCEAHYQREEPHLFLPS